MKSLVILALTICSIILIFSNNEQSASNLQKFNQYKTLYGKKYLSDSVEYYRRQIFIQNIKIIENHNKDKSQTYWLGITYFADLSKFQFVQSYLSNRKVVQNSNFELNKKLTLNYSYAAEIDWISRGKVSPVRNQLQCGAYWAFSAVAALQSAYLINGQNNDLSEQQLVDCSGPFGTKGCDGGWMDQAFQYVVKKGITYQALYPYVQTRQQQCLIDGGSWKIRQYSEISGCDKIMNALNSQPISVAVDASFWSLYRGGIFSTCGTTVNHGVLLVGANNDYWRVKNSWGTTWGQVGYIRLARGNTCGICSYASFPII